MVDFQALLTSLGSKLVVAAVFLLIGFVFARLIGKLVGRVLHELELDNIYGAMTSSKVSLEDAISSFVTYLLYFAVVLLVLAQLGINTLVFSIVAVGVVLILLVSVFLSLRDFLPNMVAGFMLGMRKLKPGDRIKVSNISGVVVSAGFLETRVKTSRGDVVFIPNSTLIKEKVVIAKCMQKKKR